MKKNKIIILLIVFLIIISLFLIYYKNSKKNKNPQPTQETGVEYNSLIPGVSTKEDVFEQLGQPLNDPSSNTLKYLSNNQNLPNQIITQDNTVLFIKEIVTAEDKKSAQDIISQYGEAKYFLFGPYSSAGFNLYIYPDKGIAYTGHQDKNTILEIWYFSPTSFENFHKTWAPKYSTTYNPIQ